MISPERLELMQQQWVRLLQPLGVELIPAYAVFDRLVAAYSEPHRFYHTLEHLGEMFRVAGRLPVADRLSVNLAIWFHDVIYDPTRSDNEERSAIVAGEWLAELPLSPTVIQWVQQLVRATAHGTPPPTEDADILCLLDADLAILGSAEARYLRYAEAIRREYAHIPEPEYQAGRAAVLRSFLARSPLYHNRLLQEEGDEPARRNLEAELQRLVS